MLVGPYSVAHLRLSQSLRNVGVTDKTPKVYLTDTLESPNNPPQFTASLLQAQLTEERKRAQGVKKDVRVFVCLGNPPYDREEQDPNEATGKRKGGWVRYGDEEQEGIVPANPILEDFLTPAREAGAGGPPQELVQRLRVFLAMGSLEGARLYGRGGNSHFHHRFFLFAGPRVCRHAPEDARGFR